MELQRITPSAATMRQVENWIRAVLPRSARPASPVPRVLAGVALALAGAAAALLLSPKTGAEMRELARKRAQSLGKQARELARRNGRPLMTQAERARRAEATH